jgi:hypothetical protein
VGVHARVIDGEHPKREYHTRVVADIPVTVADQRPGGPPRARHRFDGLGLTRAAEFQAERPLGDVEQFLLFAVRVIADLLVRSMYQTFMRICSRPSASSIARKSWSGGMSSFSDRSTRGTSSSWTYSYSSTPVV